MSLDALRGFDMFWIIGAGSAMDGLNQTTATGITKVLATQLDHVEWEGFRFYDLIFPLFVFIVGVSMVFSLGRAIEQFTWRTTSSAFDAWRGALLAGMSGLSSTGTSPLASAI